MPVAVLALVSTAGNMRYVRAAMLDVIGRDYVRTTRPKGLSERLTVGKQVVETLRSPQGPRAPRRRLT